MPDLGGMVWGPHWRLRGGPRSPRCLLRSYEGPALQSSTLGCDVELVDEFTYSISLDPGQAVYTQDPVPNLATCQGPPRAAP